MYDCKYIILKYKKNVTFICPEWKASFTFTAWLFCHDENDDNDDDDNDDDDDKDDDDDDLVDGQWLPLYQPWTWSSLGSWWFH